MTLPAGVHQVYDYWKQNLKPGGFGFSARIINYPDGKPGDVGLFFTWAKSGLEVIIPKGSLLVAVPGRGRS